MRLDHAWIGAHIPHQGSMCLLDAVLSWDQQQLLCRAGGHRAVDHPLRAHGRLGSACAIEYAAQAVAVHGALLQASLPSPTEAGTGFGLLASARAVDLAVTRLDDLAGDLLISAWRLHGDAHGALYAFAVTEDRRDPAVSERRLLAQGRLSLRLGATDVPSAQRAGDGRERSAP